MSTLRATPTTYVSPSRLPKGPNGRALCRWCQTEVPKGRRSFCSDPCVDEWQIRTNPGHARRLVEQRDRGVCALCGLDTENLLAHINGPASVDRRTRSGRRWTVEQARQRADLMRSLGLPAWRTSLWDMDHVVPVVEGGGECGLDGLRTLCWRCHKAVTAELRARLAKPKAPKRPSRTVPTLGLPIDLGNLVVKRALESVGA